MINKKKLIHCITNPISINQCANAILAVGAKPIMAEHPGEVAEITATADALLLNLGNITDARMEAMPISLKTAKEKGIPIVLDIAGFSCSSIRRKFTDELLQKAIPTVIKGNYSEIFAMYNREYKSAGVDADEELSKEKTGEAVVSLANKYNTIILATGETDIVTDGKRLIFVNNGTEQLAKVTGTGCMLGALCASYLATDNSLDSVIYACAVMGISGELSKTADGNGTFMQRLMDKLSTTDKNYIQKNMKVEEKVE